MGGAVGFYDEGPDGHEWTLLDRHPHLGWLLILLPLWLPALGMLTAHVYLDLL